MECGLELGCVSALANNSIYVELMKILAESRKTQDLEDEALPPSQTSSLASVSSVSMMNEDFSPLSKSSKSSGRSSVSKLGSQEEMAHTVDSPSARPTGLNLPKFNLKRSMSARHCLRRRQRRTFLMIARPNASTFFADALINTSVEGIRRAEEQKKAQIVVIPGTGMLLEHDDGQHLGDGELQRSASAGVMQSGESSAPRDDDHDVVMKTTTDFDMQAEFSDDDAKQQHSVAQQEQQQRDVCSHTRGESSPCSAGSPKSKDVWAMELDEAQDAASTEGAARQSMNSAQGFTATQHEPIKTSVTDSQMSDRAQKQAKTDLGHVHHDTEKSVSAHDEHQDAQHSTRNTVGLTNSGHANADLTSSNCVNHEGTHAVHVDQPSTTASSSSRENVVHSSDATLPKKEDRNHGSTGDTHLLGTALVSINSAASSLPEIVTGKQSHVAVCIKSTAVEQQDSVVDVQSCGAAVRMDYGTLSQVQLQEECQRRGIAYYGSKQGVCHSIHVCVCVCVCVCVHACSCPRRGHRWFNLIRKIMLYIRV
jgi:hypothetical protein